MKLKFATCVLAAAAVGVTACRKAPAGGGPGQTATPTASGRSVAGGQPPKPVPAVLPNVVARVNGEDVKKADFERMLHTIEARAGGPLPPERRDEIMRGALDQLVVYTLLSQESRHRQIKVEDAEIDAKLEQLRRPFPNEDAFKRALVERGMSLDVLKHDARVDLSVNKLMEAETGNLAAVSDQEARDFYQKNPDKFKQDEAVRASHILIRVDQKADAAARKKAKVEIDAVLKQARAGADFAKLAQEHSQDGSAAQGGDINFFTRGQMPGPFEDTAFRMKPGQISDVVQSQFGYHIIKLTDRRPARTVPYEEVNGQIKQFLTEQRKGQRAQAFIEGLKSRSKIEVLI